MHMHMMRTAAAVLFDASAADRGSRFRRKDEAEVAERVTLKQEISDISKALLQRDQQIQAFAEKAEAEIKEHGTMLNSTKAILEAFTRQAEGWSDRLQDLEQKLARRGVDEEAAPAKSIGALFSESESFLDLQKKKRGIARMGLKAVTNLTSLTTGTGGVGDAIRPVRLPEIIVPQDRPMTVRDLIMPGTTTSNAIEYVQESGFQNMARVVSEGASKPQSDLSLDLASAHVRTIAHWIKASKQVLDDIPMLQSYIDGRLRYGLMYVEEAELLAGDGTGQHILGLIPQSTDYDTGLDATGDTKIDKLRRAMLQVRIAEYRATGIVLNPIDWCDIELTKDNEGRYIKVDPNVNNGQNIWGLPVIDSNAMPQGQFMVGAFKLAAQVFDREEAAVEVSTEDADNFTKNMVTIRAEERLALAVFRPESFVNGVFN